MSRLVNARPSAHAGGVDVIVRCHTLDRSLELDMALMSAFHQTYNPVHVILVLQAPSADDLEAARCAVHAYDWAARHVTPTIVSVDSPPGVDARSKLLNAGLAAARHRYAAFLDFDDYLYGHAYEHLTQAARDDDAALAFGGIVVKHVRVFKDSIYNVRRIADPFPGRGMADFIKGNFCPIHSFIIDRTKVGARELYFNEKLTRLEDYDLLLRMALKYKFSFSGLDRKVGVYNWRLDGSNSVQTFEVDDEKQVENAKQWSAARQHIWRLKMQVMDNVQM